MKKIFCLIFLCFVVTFNAFSQAKEISEDESVQELVKAFMNFSENSYRKTRKTETYKNGKQFNSTEEIEESVKPTGGRFLKIEKNDGLVNKFETIIIGEKYYCRKNKQAWVKSDNSCGESKRFVKAMEVRVSSKYTTEETKLNNLDVKLYRQYLTYDDDGTGLHYWDYKFWIGSEGFILRREIETGKVKTKEILSRMIEINEINPKDLKIEAPIIKDQAKQNL